MIVKNVVLKVNVALLVTWVVVLTIMNDDDYEIFGFFCEAGGS